MVFGVIDGIFAAVILIALIIGFIKGFYDLITPPIRFIAAISITFLLAGPIIDAWLGPYFSGVISESITESIIEKCPDLSAQDPKSSLPFFFKALAFFFGVDIFGAASNMEEGVTVYEAIGSAIGNPVGNLVAMIVTYLALFIISMLLLKLVIELLGNVFTAGPLNAIDKALGLIFAFAVSSLLCCIIATIVNAVAKDYDGGFLYDFLLSLNPFVTQNN